MVTPRASCHRPDRRAFLTAASLALAALPLRAATARPRLAAIDWAMLETAIAIGHMPVAACELLRFRADAVVPEVPETVTDLGLRGAPNFELLQLTRPDLILSSPYYTRYEDKLARIAPVLSLPFYTPGEPPVPRALDALDDLAGAVEDPDAGRRARTDTDDELDRIATRLAPFSDRPVALIAVGDARHVRAFGFDSLFGSTLVRLGLQNAWSGLTEFSFLAPVPLERLAAMPEARLVIVGDIPVEARHDLSRSILWHALPAVRDKRLFQLPDMNAFGAVPAALRFANELARAFETGPHTTT